MVQDEALDVMDDTTVNEEDANRILDMLAEIHVPDQVSVYEQEQVQEQMQEQVQEQGFKCRWCAKTYAKQGACLDKHQNSCKKKQIQSN